MKESKGRKPIFCEKMCKVVLNHFDEVIKTRACYIVIALLEDESTKPLLKDVIKEGAKKVQQLHTAQEKQGKVDSGIKILHKLMNGNK